MDNGGIGANTSDELKWKIENLSCIFEPYGFGLQQFITNDSSIQTEIDRNLNEETPETVKLLGLQWSRTTDALSTKSLMLDGKANTKRLILKSIAGHFDLFGFTGPILNRARLFLHGLQCDSTIGWDSPLSEDLMHEWRKICKQVNSSKDINIDRFVGHRDGSYRLIAFVDSSKEIYGAVIFIQDITSGKVSFLMAKNRLVNRQLSTKSIPALEFQAITLGTEMLIDLYRELSGPSCVRPINILNLDLYSDSMVSLSWINSYVHKLDKMNKRSIFILNRLEHLTRLCEVHTVRFQFVSGIQNPADHITRPVSYKILVKSNYFSGPEFLMTAPDSQMSQDDTLVIIVPNPVAKTEETVSAYTSVKHLMKGPPGGAI